MNNINPTVRSIRDRVVNRLMNKYSFDKNGANILYECARADGLIESLVRTELYGELATESVFEEAAVIITDKIMVKYE